MGYEFLPFKGKVNDLQLKVHESIGLTIVDLEVFNCLDYAVKTLDIYIEQWFVK